LWGVIEKIDGGGATNFPPEIFHLNKVFGGFGTNGDRWASRGWDTPKNTKDQK
jgi:hypothetical protein